MVPSMWYQLVHHLDFQKTDFSSVFGAHSGAAYLPHEISDKVLGRMPNNGFFSEGYGMSETVRCDRLLESNDPIRLFALC